MYERNAYQALCTVFSHSLFFITTKKVNTKFFGLKFVWVRYIAMVAITRSEQLD